MKWSGAFVALAMHLSVPQSGLSFAPTTGAACRRRLSWHHPRRSFSSEAPPSWHRKSCVYTTSPRDGQEKQALHATSNNWFSQFWRTNIADRNGDTLGAAKEKLKERLLDIVRSTERGISTSEEQRQDIDELIAALEPFNPNAKVVTSESLSALWILEWTTEKEIIFLMESGLPWKPSGPVQQEIDVNAKTLSNRMLFGDDSVFEVLSSIDPESSGPRVNFEFKACKLTYGGFTLPLPPVGKGWFESVYLDQDLRVTRDVRGDVTVLVKSQSQSQE